MLKTTIIVGGLLFAAVGPMRDTDPYKGCAYYHWAQVQHNRELRDLNSMWEHLDQLDALAGRLAVERKISRDGAHAILRREAEAMLTYLGTDFAVVSRAADACARLPH